MDKHDLNEILQLARLVVQTRDAEYIREVFAQLRRGEITHDDAALLIERGRVSEHGLH